MRLNLNSDIKEDINPASPIKSVGFAIKRSDDKKRAVLTSSSESSDYTKSRKTTESKHTESNRSSSSGTMISSQSSDNSDKRRELELDQEERIAAWKLTREYQNLPEKLRNLVINSIKREKHSTFYYKLDELTKRIYMFQSDKEKRVPAYERIFRDKKILEQQKAMAKAYKQKRRQLRKENRAIRE